MSKKPPLNPDEVTLLTNLLSRLEPGRQPFPIFKEMARINRIPIVDLVPFYINQEGDMKVFMGKREDDDIFWPSMLDIPGTVVLATDEETFDAPINRLLKDEMGSPETRGEPIYVRSQLQDGVRGTELATSFAIELASVPTVGKLYSLNKLPESLSEHQINLIAIAATRFKEVKNIT